MTSCFQSCRGQTCAGAGGSHGCFGVELRPALASGSCKAADNLRPSAAFFACCSLAPQPCMAAAMDAGSCQPFTNGQAQAEWQQLLSDMKRRRREAAAQVTEGQKQSTTVHMFEQPSPA